MTIESHTVDLRDIDMITLVSEIRAIRETAAALAELERQRVAIYQVRRLLQDPDRNAKGQFKPGVSGCRHGCRGK
jgi:hypothetical protein